jgi:hypothetical protein
VPEGVAAVSPSTKRKGRFDLFRDLTPSAMLGADDEEGMDISEFISSVNALLSAGDDHFTDDEAMSHLKVMESTDINDVMVDESSWKIWLI